MQISSLLDQLVTKVEQKQAQKQAQQLSYPFRFYPLGRQVIVPAFYDDIYRLEIVRCKKFLEAQNYSETMHVVFTVGSLIDNRDWRVPSSINRSIHFPTFLRMSPIPVQIICIAPLESSIPELIKVDRELGNNWEEIGFLSYRFFDESNDQHYYYYHFNTLLPEFVESDFATFDGKKAYWKGTDKRLKKTHCRNLGVFTKIQKDDRTQVQLKKGIDENLDSHLDIIIKTSPSDRDLLFVKSFYKVLNRWMNKIQTSNNILVILNFAVFANIDVDFDYFCKHLYAISQKFTNTIFLSFMFNLVPQNKFIFKINYFHDIYVDQNFVKSNPESLDKIGVTDFAFLYTIDAKSRNKTFRKTILSQSF